MLGKLKKILVSLCLCGLISACASHGGVKKPSEGNKIKKGEAVAHTEANTARPFYKTEVFQFIVGVATLYGLSKMDKGLEMASLYSNHSLKNKEIEKVGTTSTQE